MRKIGSLASAALAQKFHRYLAAQGIDNKVDAESSEWNIWVFDEDKVESGKEALEDFSSEPDAQRFHVKEPPPPAPPKPATTPKRPRSRAGSPYPPLTVALVVSSIWVSLATQFGKANPDVLNQISISNVVEKGHWIPPEVLQGEVWRLVTPIFLHLDILHLVFNMFWLNIFAGTIERQKGTPALLGMVLLIAVVSNFSQYWFAGPAFGGMSGVLYGLFGYLWMRSKFLPGDGFFMPNQTVVVLLLWLVACMIPPMSAKVANAAHVSGLISGILIGIAPRLWRGPFD